MSASTDVTAGNDVPPPPPTAASLAVDAARGGAATAQVLLQNGSAPTGTTESTAASKPASGWTTVLDWLVKLVPAAASALGLVGFVGATGAALTWWRYWTAGLPANQALKAVPLDERLITGAGALIVFLLLGAAATAVIYTIDEPGRPTGPMRQGLGALVTAEVLVAIWVTTLLLQGEETSGAVKASIVIVGWGAAGWLMTYDPAEPAGDGEPKAPYSLKYNRSFARAIRNLATWPLRWTVAPFAVLSDRLHAELPDKKSAWGRLTESGYWKRVRDKVEWLCPVSHEAERLELTPAEKRQWLVERPTYEQPADEPAFKRYGQNFKPGRYDITWRREQPFLWLRRVSWFGYLCAVIASTTTAGLLRWATGDWVVPAAFVVALGLAALIFGVCRSTRAFWPYGLAVVLSVSLFGTFTEAALLAYEPQGQAVAVIRADGTSAVSGLYVADATDGIWLSPVSAPPNTTCDKTPPHGSASILLVPRKDVAHYSIGGVKDVCDAVGQAPTLLDDLKETFPATTPKS